MEDKNGPLSGIYEMIERLGKLRPFHRLIGEVEKAKPETQIIHTDDFDKSLIPFYRKMRQYFDEIKPQGTLSAADENTIEAELGGLEYYFDLPRVWPNPIATTDVKIEVKREDFEGGTPSEELEAITKDYNLLIKKFDRLQKKGYEGDFYQMTIEGFLYLGIRYRVQTNSEAAIQKVLEDFLLS
ncbi:hypothetical protein CMO93_02945 [Candidatus Woesearchaeota archaeon]|nr:hypothetical protein [Candidatus Woesearchaeota archaeon]|tara:strand:- start:9024 stop:9575 length:552 start_codon:yes stop_codon:yes gene_type:complete